MRTKLGIKGFVLAICFLAFGVSVSANDTIRFTWRTYTTNKNIIISATLGENFTVYWGDNTYSTYTGAGNYNITAYHTYAVANDYTVKVLAGSPSCRFTVFNCSDRSLSSLDVSNSTALEELYCSYNVLNSLDVGSNMTLRYLYCDNNSLSSLDVSKSTALEELYCSSNSLSSLDVSGNTVLRYLYCNNNSLSSLDVSSNTALRELVCYYNSLSSLDLSNNTELEAINFSYNSLSNLDLSNNTELEAIDCSFNRLPLSYLYAFSKMINTQYRKHLGQQTLLPQTVAIGGIVDFSSQAAFGTPDTPTVFIVEKRGVSADSAIDYIMENGVITFYNTGIYIVTMTNEAIISNINYPVEVIAEFNVGNVGIADAAQEIAEVKIYPNPTTGKLTVKCAETLHATSVQMFDAVGQVVGTYRIPPENTEMQIDISHLSAGLYFLKIDGKTVKVVKQ